MKVTIQRVFVKLLKRTLGITVLTTAFIAMFVGSVTSNADLAQKQRSQHQNEAQIIALINRDFTSENTAWLERTARQANILCQHLRHTDMLLHMHADAENNTAYTIDCGNPTTRVLSQTLTIIPTPQMRQIDHRTFRDRWETAHPEESRFFSDLAAWTPENT